MNLNIILYLCWLWATAADAIYELTVWDINDPPAIKVSRMWIGDGVGYVGNTVPSAVKSAFNVTVLSERSDLMYLEVDKPNSRPGTPSLPSPSFMVANVALASADAFYIAHSAAELGSESAYIFSASAGFWSPATRAGPTPGAAYLIPTNVEGTFSVRWIANETKAREMNGKPVFLSSRS